MSVPYQAVGRVTQKARTYEALIAAARRLLANGETPSVEDAAGAAGVSRTTAYRYFPTQEALLIAAHPEIGPGYHVLGNDPPKDVGARFAIVFEEMARQIEDNEIPLRSMLRLSLETQRSGEPLVLRQGRRRKWIGEALAPLAETMPAQELERLVLAIAASTGIEAFVWLSDVAGLSKREALDVMRFAAATLLASKL